MTVTIIGTVTARPDCRDELEAILSRQVAPTRSEAGCINYDSMSTRLTRVSLFSTRTGEARKTWIST